MITPSPQLIFVPFFSGWCGLFDRWYPGHDFGRCYKCHWCENSGILIRSQEENDFIHGKSWSFKRGFQLKWFYHASYLAFVSKYDPFLYHGSMATVSDSSAPNHHRLIYFPERLYTIGWMEQKMDNEGNLVWEELNSKERWRATF